MPVATSRSPSPSTSPVAIAGVAVAGVNDDAGAKPLRVVWSNRKEPVIEKAEPTASVAFSTLTRKNGPAVSTLQQRAMLIRP